MYTNSRGETCGGVWSKDRPVSWDGSEPSLEAKPESRQLAEELEAALTTSDPQDFANNDSAKQDMERYMISPKRGGA
jgi:hypothetical protein